MPIVMDLSEVCKKPDRGMDRAADRASGLNQLPIESVLKERGLNSRDGGNHIYTIMLRGYTMHLKIPNILDILLFMPLLITLVLTGSFAGESTLDIPVDSLAVERLLAKADSAYTRGRYSEAIAQYRDVQPLLRLTADYETLVRTYLRTGSALMLMREYDAALDELQKAEELTHTRLDEHHILLARTYRLIGTVHYHTGNNNDAAEFYDKSLAVHRFHEFSDPVEAGGLYNNIGALEPDHWNSIEWYKKAVAVYELDVEAASWQLGRTLRNISLNYNRLGMLDSAIVYIERALDVYSAHFGDNHPRVADIYSLIGSYRSYKGDHSGGLDYHYRALSIYNRMTGDVESRIAGIYNDLGMIYDEMGEYETALEYYAKGLEIWERIATEHRDDLLSRARMYTNAGVTYRNLNRFHKAIASHYKSLDYFRKVYGDDHQYIAGVYNSIGVTYAHMDSTDRALEYYAKGVDIVDGTGHPRLSMFYNNIGEIYERRNDVDGALAYYHKAIEAITPAFSDTSMRAIPSDLQTQSPRLLTTYLGNKASLLRKRYEAGAGTVADLEAAFDAYRTKVQLVHRAHSGIRTQEGSIWLTGESHHIHEEGIRTALDLYEVTEDRTHIEHAFLFSELNRAQALWRLVTDLDARAFGGIPDSLLELENTLRRDLAYYETEMLKHKPGTERYGYYTDAYYDSRTRYGLLVSHFEKSYPEYFEIRHRADTLSMAQIRERLDDRGALIQFFTGTDETYVFVLTADTLGVYRSGDAASLAVDVPAYVQSMKRVDRTSFFNLSHRLYNLLIVPVLKYIEDVEKLTFIPDGVLHYVPFETLITDFRGIPRDRARYNDPAYLIERYEIAYHYSARLFVHMRARGTDRASPAPAFAGFAPVFQDESGIILASDADPAIRFVTDDARYRSVIPEPGAFSPLPYSYLEVEAIVDLFTGRGIQATGFLFDDSSEESFKKYAGDYSIIHIASHGIMHEDTPKLSGIIFAGSGGEASVEDGILFSGEIYNLTLNADLIVLASCDSGIGELVRGEGLIALTRGFLYAGASNVVVSLWKISDRHTSQLMISFYERVLEGKPYARALREAKLTMLRQEATALPRFWGGFVLIGD
jgi:CHAT domain-containing protein